MNKTFTTPFMTDVFAEHVAHDARILDFGCGYGRVMSQLADAGFSNLVGIDFSQTLVDRGRKENPSFDFTCYSGGTVPYEDDSFDAAIMMGVFTCMTETKLQAQTLIDLKRIIQPGGYLYVADFLLNRDKRNLDRYGIGKEKHGIYGIFDVDDGGVLRHHDRNHMEALFFDFETIVFEEMVFDTMHGHHSAGFYALLQLPL
jgi:SAM-dependent methyltransferase